MYKRQVEDLLARPKFEQLTPIFPNEKIRLETDGATISTRMMDIIAPIGKGQRGMIVSQPKTGKTTILKPVSYTHLDVYKRQDEKVIIDRLRGYIEKYIKKAGFPYKIDIYQSGEEFAALEKAMSGYDIVFMDVNMKEMDGIKTCLLYTSHLTL